MFVVRPEGIRKTPRLLARELGWQTRRYPSKERLDYTRDFFMTNVPDAWRAPPEFISVTDFFSAHKAGQRSRLRLQGLNVPDFALGGHGYELAENPGPFVIRPLRHSRSENYRV